jgi:peptidoglycan/LPS O-acetylase OafA/YrhL
VAAAGLVLLVLAAFADPLGIGGDDAFGWEQALGTALGAVALIAGLASMYVPRRREVQPGAEE